MNRTLPSGRDRLTVLVLALSLLPASATYAQQTQPLVASSSAGPLINIQAQWESPVTPGADPSSMVIARCSTMELRLAIPQGLISPPRRARIYISLPLTAVGLISPGKLELNWQTGGRFLAGTVRPGQRTILYEGVVDSATLADQIAFTIRVDADDVLDRLRLDPAYEIEAL